MSMAINFVKVGIYYEVVSSLKLPHPLILDPLTLQGHRNYFSCCITTITRPMATTLGKVVT